MEAAILTRGTPGTSGGPLQKTANRDITCGAQRNQIAAWVPGQVPRQLPAGFQQLAAARLAGLTAAPREGVPDPATAPPPRAAFGKAGSRSESMTPEREREQLLPTHLPGTFSLPLPAYICQNAGSKQGRGTEGAYIASWLIFLS